MLKQIWDKHKDIYQQEGLCSLIVVLFRSTKKRFLNPIEKLLFKLASETKTDAKTIIFQSEGDFCDNARALYEYMLANGYGKKYQLIWLVSNPKNLTQYKNSCVKFVKFPPDNRKENILFTYYKNKAKFFFFTHPNWMSSWKKDQTVVNLWHGCGCKKSKGGIKIDDFFDIGFTIGKFYTTIVSACFGCNTSKLLDIGYPRNDILTTPKVTHDSTRQKTIIWMPTFRKCNNAAISENYINTGTGLPLVETNKVMDELDNFLVLKNAKILLKVHHLQANLLIFKRHFKNIEIITDEMFLQSGRQLYELLAETDALITDYSSVSHDYLLADKPIAFILSDYEDYEKSRGFVFPDPKKYMPGKHIYKLDELLSFIESVVKNEDGFSAERAKIRNLVYTYADGKSSERILNYLNISK